jgi:cysteine desulfurase / selenocysteine lyase
MPIYLDNAATSHPKPEAVYQTVNEVLRRVGANPGRSSHKLAAEASQWITRTRDLLATLLEIEDPQRIVFTSNATEAINLGLKGVLKTGDQVVTTSMEHNSVIRPLRFLESRGVATTIVSCSAQGKISVEEMERAFQKNTRLVIMTQASNVTGGFMPVAEVVRVAHRHGIPVMVDAAQTAGVLPISVKSLAIDLLAAPGHKGLLGPQGTGFLYVGESMEVQPLKEGGTGSKSESETQPDFLPDRLEAGTQNTPGIAGLGAGVEFLLSQGLETVREKEMALSRMLWEGLQGIKGVRLYGPNKAEERTAVVTFNLEGMNPQVVASILDTAYDVAVRSGLHCAALAHRTLGTFPEGTVRVSPGFFSETREIEFFLAAVREITNRF